MRLFHDVPAVYLHRDPVDFRKATNGLALIVEHAMSLSPYEPALFLFCNKRRDKIKVLYWDDTGYCLRHKRLDEARFSWPRQERAVPVLNKLREFLYRHKPRTAPTTALSKALTYLGNQWQHLIGYVDDDRYPIDNNRGENAIRPFVIGRKN